MPRVLWSAIVVIFVTASLIGQTPEPSLYITPSDDGFEVYLAAAMVKKGVPVSVLDHEEGATYVLRAAKIETKQVGGGAKREDRDDEEDGIRGAVNPGQEEWCGEDERRDQRERPEVATRGVPNIGAPQPTRQGHPNVKGALR